MGQPLDHASALTQIKAQAPHWIFATGYTNDLVLMRKQMADLKIEAPLVTMIAAPETVKRDDTLIKGPNPLAGATATNLSPLVADELGLAADTSGVVISKVEKGPAMRFLKRGDIVLEVNGAKIDSVDALGAALADSQNIWRIAINRGGRVLKLTIGG